MNYCYAAKNTISCDVELVDSFDKSMGEKILRLDALLVTNAILALIIVGIGAYVQHYRHRSFTRFIYLGATTLFIPIISYVVSISSEPIDYITETANGESYLAAECQVTVHIILVLIWAILVQIIVINTSLVVAIDDREGQNIAPPFELLVQGVWTLYLGILYTVFYTGYFSTLRFSIEFVPSALVCAKIMFKYYALEKARRSFALGRNPLLIFGYMQQLQQHGDHLYVGHGGDARPPPLLVSGEETRLVEKKPCGYMFKDDGSLKTTSPVNKSSLLVTIDRVWASENSMLLPTRSRSRLQDLCLSFALFKLLRCRFMRCNLTNVHSTGTLNFFWALLLKQDDEHARVFGVIAHELSFINDYYYSSLPISYSKCWLPILSIVISLSTIGYCIFIMVLFLPLNPHLIHQIRCKIMCIQGSTACIQRSSKGFGKKNFDVVPILLLAALVMIAEVRDMASYICSNWTKVALICRLVNHASSQSQHSICMQKWVGFLLHCRCKMMNHHWDGKMGQCSLLVISPRRTLLPTFLKQLLRLPDGKRKVKVPEEVKVCIINALRSIGNGRRLSKGKSSVRGTQDGESFLWACNGEGTTDTILVWHIATSILEAKHPYRHHEQEHSSPPVSYSDHMTTATHLSRYCVYLVKRCPELLPDDEEWSKSLYKDVKKDAERALADHTSASSATPEEEYDKLVELLSANSQHDVLKNGVKLGKELVVETNNDETAWKLLAEFWSEMILYVAPSDNLKAHKEAIARGSELITLLWAMLFHAGIVNRPGEEDEAVSTSASTSAPTV
jgi:hypothetical protein